MTPKVLAKQMALLALTKKAADVTVMDLRKVTDMADFFVICSGDSVVMIECQPLDRGASRSLCTA